MCEHQPGSVVTLLGETEHFSGKKWSIKVDQFSGEVKALCTKAYTHTAHYTVNQKDLF